MLLQLARPLLTDFLKTIHRSIFLKFVLNSIVYFQILITKYFLLSLICIQKVMIFQCACQDFSYWRIVVPHSSQKIQLFSPPVESPHCNLDTYLDFSITKESKRQNNFLSNFPPIASKNTPPSKIPNSP